MSIARRDPKPPRSFRTLIKSQRAWRQSIKDLKDLRALPIAAAIDMQVLKDLKRGLSVCVLFGRLLGSPVVFPILYRARVGFRSFRT